MKYLGLWSSGLRMFFEKFVKPFVPPSYILKACIRYFLLIFCFFTKLQPFEKYEKYLLFHLKSSFCSRDIQIFVIFSFLSTLSRLEKTNGSGIIYDVIN